MILRTLVFLFLSSHFIFAQGMPPVGDENDGLYIGDSTYVYVKDIVFTSNYSIRMETAASNIFLRGDAQLYQFEDTKNSDAGSLSVYQKQSTGIYEYNYWCSPVGVSQDGITTENKDFDAETIYDPEDDTDISNVTSESYDFTRARNGTATRLSSYWMYTLISGGGYTGWTLIDSTGTVSPGYGFTMKGSPNVNNTLDFRGRPNNGTFYVDCTFDGTDSDPNSGKQYQVSTLTGNPYPSALDLKEFIKENTSIIEGEVLFWEQAETNTHVLIAYEGGYGIYSPGDLEDDNDNGSYTIPPFQFYDSSGGGIGGSANTGVDYESLSNVKRRFAAIGKGFVVNSKDEAGAAAGGDITFNNNMRLYMPQDTLSGSIFGKSESIKKSLSIQNKRIPQSNNGINYLDVVENPTIVPTIKIHTKINNSYYKESLIAFRNSTPNNNTYNRFFDAKNQNSTASSDTYLISENTQLSIKSIKYSEDVTIPFGVKLKGTDTGINVKIHYLKNVEENINVYLHDIDTDTYTDIKNGEFQIYLPEGTYNNRFEITFKNENSTTIDDDIIKTLNVFQNNTISELIIINSEGIDIESLLVYDILGKKVIEDTNIKTQKEKTYPTKYLSNGVYVVQLLTANNKKVIKKIIVSNIY